LAQSSPLTIQTPRRAQRRQTTLLWALALMVAVPYLVTSLVVVLNSAGSGNGTVWLPSFPAWYYAAQRALWAPLQPFVALFDGYRSTPNVTYAQYTLASRGPVLALSLAVFGTSLFALIRRSRLRLRRGQAIVLGSLALALVIYAAVIPVRVTVNTGIAALDPRDINRMRDFLRSFGPWAPVVSFLLMVLHAITVPFPAFVITLANGLLFGAFWGTVLSWTSAMVCAAVCYYIARALGRPVVERFVGTRTIDKSDAFFERYGSHAVLITRLIPVISFDGISYAAGLTRMGIVPFLVATGIGQLPATIIYSVLGENIGTGSKALLWALGALASLIVLGVAMRGRFDRQLAQREKAPSREQQELPDASPQTGPVGASATPAEVAG
jgi:uncharacterized membrane protein YdjX (TVP38/TMEM64 family)